jgi:signal transduction histidine kinase
MDLDDPSARLHALETQCAQLRQQLEEVTRSRDDFLATVSHELRSPLTGMLLQMEMLQRSVRRDAGVPAVTTERLTRLQGQMRRYARRATTLLDASRLAGGGLQLHLEPLNLSVHCEVVLQDFQPEIEHAQTTLQADIEPDVTGEWDSVAMEQILANLVSNALKYGNGRPVQVTLKSEGATARFEVKDEGVGISEADLNRVFERFERVATTRHKPGFGVGLWVVRQLVEAMQGRILVSSAPGKGTTFTVILPRATH